MHNKFSHKFARYLILGMLSLVFVLSFLAVQGAKPIQALFNDEVNEKNFKLVAENDLATLEYNRREALFRVTSKATGATFDTKAVDGKKGNKHTKALQRSDLIFKYISDIQYGQTTKIDNYTMSIDLKQYESEEIPNGLRIRYHLGQDEITLQDLPKYVPAEKLYDKVISKLDKKQRKSFEEQYTLTGDRYVRRNDSGVAQLKVNRLYEYFFEVGDYTLEDLAEDNETYGVEVEAANLTIDCAIDYRLEGLDLVVEFPIQEFQITGDLPLSNVQILPYLMAAETGEEGYILIPDGAGAIQYFDSPNQTATSFKAEVYGTDPFRAVNSYKYPRYPLTMPMAAINFKDHAIMGILEEGAELATISTELSGRSDEYNKLSFDFDLINVEQVATVGSSNVTLPRASTDIFDDVIRIRYRLIDGPAEGQDEIDLVQLAQAYRNYLQDIDHFPVLANMEENPELIDPLIFLEFLGSMEKEVIQFGIPIKQQVALTTADDVAAIMERLEEAGIPSVHAIMSGYFNGGLAHNGLSSLKYEKVLGALEDYQQLAKDHPDSIFSTAFNLGMVQEAKGFKKSEAFARMLSGEYAQLPLQEPITERAEIKTKESPWFISPNYYDTYFSQLLASFKDANLHNLAIFDLGREIVPDYNRSQDTNRWRSLGITNDELGKLSSALGGLTLSYPNDYALPHAKALFDMPLSSNGFKAFDADVPFLQMVLGHSIMYASEPLNEEMLSTPQRTMLKLIEYGTKPFFQISAADPEIYNHSDFENLVDTENDKVEAWAIELEKTLKPIDEAIDDAELIAYDQPTKDTRALRYDNGTAIYLNYAEEPQTVEGVDVPALSYVLIEEGDHEAQ